jgi:hypothetical protein
MYQGIRHDMMIVNDESESMWENQTAFDVRELGIYRRLFRNTEETRKRKPSVRVHGQNLRRIQITCFNAVLTCSVDDCYVMLFYHACICIGPELMIAPHYWLIFQPSESSRELCKSDSFRNL